MVSWAPPAPTDLPTVPANGTAGEGTGVPCAPHIPSAISGNTSLFAGEARGALYPCCGSAGKGKKTHGVHVWGSFSLYHPMVTSPPAEPVCGPYEFPCRSGQCVPRGWVCDSEADCPDDSDELGCNQSCALGHFPCALGAHCIPYDHLCDGVPHCPDRSDESDDNCGEAQRVPSCPFPSPGMPSREQDPQRGSARLHSLLGASHHPRDPPCGVRPDGMLSPLQALPTSHRARGVLSATTVCV